MIIRGSNGSARWRLTFGEPLTEACSSIGQKNARNDHSPRDFEVVTSTMSDLRFGQTGFRFVRIVLLEVEPVSIQSIIETSYLPLFENEAQIRTNDELLNEIIKTATYTLSSLYCFGDTENVTNSLDFLRATTSSACWMNNIPSYSAWWVINLCDYCRLTGNWEYGSMLSRGATSFWENFDMDWLENSGRIENGGAKVSVVPHLLGLTDIDATIPMQNRVPSIRIHGTEIQIEALEGTQIIR